MASKGGRACPNCGSTHIEQHDSSGASVCTECGVILEENAIVSAVEFVEGAGGASSMVGQFVSATSSKAYTSQGVGRGGYGFSRDSRETTLANGRRRITEVASRLRLGGHYIDSAHRLFTMAVEKNFVQGRRTIHVVAACLYIACRQEKSQHMLIDFSDALQVNVYTLGTCFLKFRRLLGLKLEILDPALYVYRFAAHLELDDQANAVAMTALRLVGRMKRDWIVAGRRPAGICAAALLIAARAHGFQRNPQDVTRILRVCGLTVTTRVKEFELTPSASLTLDQFNKVELEQEADPPIYTKNRILEARARAIQEQNVELLESGALDNPMESKRQAIKWRNGQPKKKDQALEDLYQTIEQDLLLNNANENENENENDASAAVTDKKAVAASASATLLEGDDDEEDAREEREGAPASSTQTGSKTTGLDEEEEEVATTERAMVLAITEKQGLDLTSASKRPVSILKKTPLTLTLTNNTTTTLEVSKSVTIHNAALTQIPKEWEKAYPKSKFGKAIILPDQALAEERQPSLVPTEGKLDTKTWKEAIPEDMMDDFDSIFRTPTEVAQKEAIFNKINKDYIDLQAQKDKVRVSTEAAETKDERDLAEQAQGHERYNRKRKGRGGRDATETTEAALLEAVQNRKISRKINYDAMSAIFDDAGSFSTSEAAAAAAGAGAEEETTMPEF